MPDRSPAGSSPSGSSPSDRSPAAASPVDGPDAPASYDVLVIGAGPAGTAAAVRAAELGARVAVAEARRTGGRA